MIKTFSAQIKMVVRSLYQQLDDSGKKKFGLAEICEIARAEYGTTISRGTVKNWAFEGSWDKTLVKVDSREESSRLLDSIEDQVAMALVSNSARHQRYIGLEQSFLDGCYEEDDDFDDEENTLNKNRVKVRRLDSRKVGLKDLQAGILNSHNVYFDHLKMLKDILVQKSNLKTEFDKNNAVIVKGDRVWEHEPVDIETFMFDKEFCGLDRERVFKCVLMDLKEIFYGNPRRFDFKYKEIIFKESIRSGKSEKISIMSAYLAHMLLCLRDPCNYFELLPGAKITIVNMSVNAKQARTVVYGKIKSKIDGCAWFKNNGYEYDPRNKLELRFDSSDETNIVSGRVYKNIYITPGNSSEYGAVGGDIFCGIMDEASIYPKKNEQDQAEVIYNHLKDRVDTTFKGKGFVVMLGNPMHLTDFLEDKIRAVKGNLDAYVIDERSHWAATKPDWSGEVFYFNRKKLILVGEEERLEKDVIAIPEPYQSRFRDDPEVSARNLGGWSLASISRFFTDTMSIDKMFTSRKDPIKSQDGFIIEFYDWFGPVNTGWYVVHVDLGLTGDALGFCLGHICDYKDRKPYFMVDLVLRVKGTKDKPNKFEDVRQLIYRLTKLGFQIKHVTFDGFQSTDGIQILESKGYSAGVLNPSIDKAVIPYHNLRNCIYERRVDCIYDSVLEVELTNLEDINGKKIDHPFKGSKDLADALCGMVNNAMLNIPVESLSFEAVEAKNQVKNIVADEAMLDNETILNNMIHGS